MAYAQHVREHFPRIIAGTTVSYLETLADEVCTSLDDFPLTTGVLGCTVFEHGEAYTAIREGLRRDEPARYRFTLRTSSVRSSCDAISTPCPTRAGASMSVTPSRPNSCSRMQRSSLPSQFSSRRMPAARGHPTQRSTSWHGAWHPPMTCH